MHTMLQLKTTFCHAGMFNDLSDLLFLPCQ